MSVFVNGKRLATNPTEGDELGQEFWDQRRASSAQTEPQLASSSVHDSPGLDEEDVVANDDLMNAALTHEPEPSSQDAQGRTKRVRRILKEACVATGGNGSEEVSPKSLPKPWKHGYKASKAPVVDSTASSRPGSVDPNTPAAVYTSSPEADTGGRSLSPFGQPNNTPTDVDIMLSVEEQAESTDGNEPSRSPTPTSSEISSSDEADGTQSPARSTLVPGSPTPAWMRMANVNPFVRVKLQDSKMYLLTPGARVPGHIGRAISQMRTAPSSGYPTLETVLQDNYLGDLGILSTRKLVHAYFVEEIFNNDELTRLLSLVQNQKMAPRTVPMEDEPHKVCPNPDMLIGYNRPSAFAHQQSQVQVLGKTAIPTDQNENLLYPFLTVKCIGDAGSLWAATDECILGGAACVNMIEQLNELLAGGRKNRSGLVSSTAFGIATNGTEARIHVSWKDGQNYNTKNMGIFLLQDPEQYILFRRCVRNILDWGVGQRLGEVRNAVDAIYNH